MLSPEILNRLPSLVFWIILIAFIVGFVLSRLAEAREDIAKMLGPIGQWLRSRAKQHVKERQEQLDRSIRAALKEESNYRAMQRRIDMLEKLIHKLESEIKKLRLVEEASSAREEMNAEFLREDAQWHIDARLAAAEEGHELPEHRSYIRFIREYRAKHNMRYGRRWNDDDPKPDEYRP